jgi:hypothetical protein
MEILKVVVIWRVLSIRHRNMFFEFLSTFAKRKKMPYNMDLWIYYFD